MLYDGFKIQEKEWRQYGLSVRIPSQFDDDNFLMFIEGIFHHWKVTFSFGMCDRKKNIFEIIKWLNCDAESKQYENIIKWSLCHTEITANNAIMQYIDTIDCETEFGIILRLNHMKIAIEYLDKINVFIERIKKEPNQ